MLSLVVELYWHYKFWPLKFSWQRYIGREEVVCPPPYGSWRVVNDRLDGEKRNL